MDQPVPALGQGPHNNREPQVSRGVKRVKKENKGKEVLHNLMGEWKRVNNRKMKEGEKQLKDREWPNLRGHSIITPMQ